MAPHSVPHGPPATLAGGASWAGRAGPDSASLDGRSAHLALPGGLARGGFPDGVTVQLWVHPDLVEQDATLVDLGSVLLGLTGGKVVASVRSHGVLRQLWAEVGPEALRWGHLALTVDPGSAVTLHLDGQQVATEPGVGPPDPWDGPPSAGAAFATQLHLLSVTPRPLTPAEVARDARADR